MTPHSSLDHSTTISRELVHRASIAEVFLTGHCEESDGSFTVAGQLPRTHSYYNDHTTSPAQYDPLLVLEVFRQTCILFSHKALGAPMDSAFIFDKGSVQITDCDALRMGAEPAEVIVHLTVTDRHFRGKNLAGCAIEASMTIDGRVCARTSLAWRWMRQKMWSTLRRRTRSSLDLTPRAHLTGTRLPAYAVGRHSPQNVVLVDADITDRGLISKVTVDRSHPGLFDHPLDHISGALQFEALRQTALYAASELLGLDPRFLALTDFDTEFTNVGEFELPTDCHAVTAGVEGDTACFELSMRQEGTEIASSRMRLSRSRQTPASLPDGMSELVAAH
ncbi:ScbA/BarX family gamma-butyrolactone biosynthesis protein [Glycomyces buryatensis]|uniref:Gamma-butyrolactone biosynthesis protein n=1 Tax=Glycomyces buryatensis TaxID=2570927 RepID=A0A4S8QRW7_9ACTN|nr:ScbA/BarX family gamma-butyrolactone biosynthesis protein [Glycomyces buryatensis]THV43384.1 gamma-butyrolactone biosynthesis protein [Glycomyces buryatensis]